MIPAQTTEHRAKSELLENRAAKNAVKSMSHWSHKQNTEFTRLLNKYSRWLTLVIEPNTILITTWDGEVTCTWTEIRITCNPEPTINIRNDRWHWINNATNTGRRSGNNAWKACNILHNTLNNRQKAPKDKTDAEIVHLEKVTREFCRNNEDEPKKIHIMPADKENSTVIINQMDYNTGIEMLLNDAETYTTLKRDPSATYERDINTEITAMFSIKEIRKAGKDALTRYDSICPRIYGLPKVHKLPSPIPNNPTIKFRPIVSCIKSPT